MPACLALARDHEPWPGGESRKRDLNHRLAAGPQASPAPSSSLCFNPGILLVARLLISRAGAPLGPISPTYQQAGTNQMKRENHRSFLLLLFLAATDMVEFRYGVVVAFRFADVSVRPTLGNKAMPADSERPRQLRERAHYGLICGPQRLFTILRAGNDVQPGLERFRHLKRGTTVPIPER